MTELLHRQTNPYLTDIQITPETVACIDERHRELFEGVHNEGYPGDMIEVTWHEGRLPDNEIAQRLIAESSQPGFTYNGFLRRYFEPPVHTAGEQVVYRGGDRDEHAHRLILAHRNKAVDTQTTIGAPNDVVESGGRYSDGRPGRARWYYWDTWPTVIALRQLGEHTLATGLIDNIADQIMRFGRPLNGNSPEYAGVGRIQDGEYVVDRSRGRSQPPVFARLVRDAVRHEGPVAYERYLKPLIIEYFSLMDGADDPNKLGPNPGDSYKSVVRTIDGGVENIFSAEGYVHEDGTPRLRAESLPADKATKEKLQALLDRELTTDEFLQLCLDLHAGAGAGTDFAAWMMGNGKDMHTIRTTRRIPPFLNALMYEMECTIADGLHAMGYQGDAFDFELRALERASTMNIVHYNKRLGYYLPFDTEMGRQIPLPSLQDGSFMLESGAVLPGRIRRVAGFMGGTLLGAGGMGTCVQEDTELSWARPKNVWAILQQSAVTGLWLAGQEQLAEITSRRYQTNVTDGLHRTGYTFEGYSRDIHEGRLGWPRVGGEYIPPKRNFIWSAATDLTFRRGGHRVDAERVAWQRRHSIASSAGSLASRAM